MRDPSVGYDIILMAETVYSVSTLPRLYKLIKKVARLVSDFFFSMLDSWHVALNCFSL